ncbi:MAG: hypothetical protein ACRETU_11020, partial [Steroidobacterales bacterium]
MRLLRELTLIVTDGHAPADLTIAALASLDRMPSAERLTARGTRIAMTADWWFALLRAVRVAVPEAQGQPLALAPVAWFGLTGQRDEHIWFATPVHLTAATDHVRLDALAPPSGDIADLLAADFRREFSAEGLILHVTGGQHWLLEIPRVLDASTADPGRLIGNDVGRSLPEGADGAYLRKLMTEMQMWLHGRATPSAGLNGLWIWGGGRVWPNLAGVALPQAASDEVLLQGLWRLGAGTLHGAVATLDEARRLEVPALVATVSLEAWRAQGEAASLQRLERDWWAPAWNALTGGSLGAFTFYLNG